LQPFSAEVGRAIGKYSGPWGGFWAFESFLLWYWAGFLKKTTNNNNEQTQIKQLFLQEAGWANIHAKLLIGSTNVHRCNIYNGQARGLLRSVLNDCLAPFASVFLGRNQGGRML